MSQKDTDRLVKTIVEAFTSSGKTVDQNNLCLRKLDQSIDCPILGRYNSFKVDFEANLTGDSQDPVHTAHLELRAYLNGVATPNLVSVMVSGYRYSDEEANTYLHRSTVGFENKAGIYHEYDKESEYVDVDTMLNLIGKSIQDALFTDKKAFEENVSRTMDNQHQR